jgi:hypothetical protein
MVEVARIEAAFSVATKEAEKGFNDMNKGINQVEGAIKRFIPGMDQIIDLGKSLWNGMQGIKNVGGQLFGKANKGSKNLSKNTVAATGNMRLFGMASSVAMAPIMTGGIAALGVMAAIAAIFVAVIATVVAFQQAAQGNFKNFIILMGVVALAIGIIPAAIIAAVILIYTQWDKIVAMFKGFIKFMGGVGNAIKEGIVGGIMSAVTVVLSWIAIITNKWDAFKSKFKLPTGQGILKSARGIIGFAKGGQVTGTGMAIVHKGETIIPNGGGQNNKQINNSITLNVGNVAGVEDDFAMSLGSTLQNELGRFTT